MKLWLISQNENDTYDTYDAAVVAAETEDEARNMTPGNYGFDRFWCSSPAAVKVKYLGEAASGIEKGEVLGSFNAG